jgi:hypothetical protein
MTYYATERAIIPFRPLTALFICLIMTGCCLPFSKGPNIWEISQCQIGQAEATATWVGRQVWGQLHCLTGKDTWHCPFTGVEFELVIDGNPSKPSVLLGKMPGREAAIHLKCATIRDISVSCRTVMLDCTSNDVEVLGVIDVDDRRGEYGDVGSSLFSVE